MNRLEPQERRLIRAPDLPAFRRALVELAGEGDPFAIRRRVVIVPTRAAADLLRRTIEDSARASGASALVLPDLLTRRRWLVRLRDAVPDLPPLAGRDAREVLLARAARDTARRTRIGSSPFPLRPGLIAAMLQFYDELRWRLRDVRRFSRTLFDDLRVERGTDRGSEDLIRQTAFLGFAFLAYERELERAGLIDEHGLRARLVALQPRLPHDHVVVAVADRPSDPRGLWPADFDCIGRLAGCSRLDVVVTDETHDAGFRDRIERELPGIEERRLAATAGRPHLVRPRASGDACTISRDREDELREVARDIRARAVRTGHRLKERTAIVSRRPLPYVYLARHVLGEAGVPAAVVDARPLAAEPFAALLDQAMAVARTGGTREIVASILRSPLLTSTVDGGDVSLADVSSLETLLAGRRATGDASSYVAEVDGWRPGGDDVDRIDVRGARRAARAAAAVAADLAPFRTAASASQQIAALADWLARTNLAEDAADRSSRARAAVLGVLRDLSAAFVRCDDERRDVDELTATVHHAIESRTFGPLDRPDGVVVVDAAAARFGEFDRVYLVGLVDTDWPEHAHRSFFYTSPLLASLGWPQEPEHARAELAAFRDLARLPRVALHLHAFELEGDAPIARSPLVEVAVSLLPDTITDDTPDGVAPVFPDEVLTLAGPIPSGLDASVEAWLARRRRRPPLSDPRFSGCVDPPAARAYRVSAVDEFVKCPFKYFSSAVLRLPEERDDEAGLTPIERGTMLHRLFERFYREWQDAGGGTISEETLPAALEHFERLVREALASLPAADRALEETRLLGSIVGRGVAERVFEYESDEGGVIARRLLEFDLRGPFRFPGARPFSETTIAVRGKADRIDVYHDGSLRVIDYKLGRLPNLDTALQAGVYAHCASQALEALDHRPHAIVDAAYLAFGDDYRFDGSIRGSSNGPAGPAAHVRAQAFAHAVARIEAGRFPPRPEREELCRWCAYAGVCRKEYQGPDDAAESV